MAYTPFKMKGHTLPGIKQRASSPSKFNKGLKAASKAGKLDNNPKFKAAVDSAPTKKAARSTNNDHARRSNEKNA